jgi:hypothetical protein
MGSWSGYGTGIQTYILLPRLIQAKMQILDETGYEIFFLHPFLSSDHNHSL